MSTLEAAGRLHVSDQTVINWIRDGVIRGAIKLDPSKRNSPIRIPCESVDELIKKQLQAMAGQGTKLRA